MARISIKSIPDLVSISDTDDNELLFDILLPDVIKGQVASITVKSGSIKFNSYGPASDSNQVYVTVTDDSFFITIPQDGIIRYQATVQPASFKIEI